MVTKVTSDALVTPASLYKVFAYLGSEAFSSRLWY